MKSVRPLSNLAQLVDQYSRYHPSAITLAQLVDFSKKRNEEESYLFLHREIPIRLSHMIKELELLPESLRQQRAVKLVEDMYWKSFEDLKRFTPDGARDEQTLSKFVKLLLLKMYFLIRLLVQKPNSYPSEDLILNLFVMHYFIFTLLK